MKSCVNCKHFAVCKGELQNGMECFEDISIAPGVIQKMLAKFGEDSQIDVAIEEMSELIKELIKYKRSKIHSREKAVASRDHVIEEMGDVLFMMEYLKTIFSISEKEIEQIIQGKTKRTKERYIDGEK